MSTTLLRLRPRRASSGRAAVRLAAALSTMSLRTRLIAMVIALDILATALIGTVIMVTARSATKVEIEASMRLAEVLVADTLGLMKDVPSSLALEALDLHFQTARHIRIAVFDLAGHPVQAASNAQASNAQAAADRGAIAPDWFVRLVAPPPRVEVFPLLVHNRRVGEVKIEAQPADEIGEAWQYAGAIFMTGLGLNVAAFGALFVLFGHALRPLAALAGGLNDLERRRYAVRLARPSLPELAVIADHFNRAASALAGAYEANRAVSRKLVTAQDDERRRTALELHDEVGPCLFALDVNTASIAAAAGRMPEGAEIGRLAAETAAIVKQVQGINRRVLDRLRPLSLGRLPLTDCLLNLLVDLSGDHAPAIHHDIGPLEPSYGSLVDLTLYRCLQEGLFNAIRHAGARRIDVAVREAEGHRLLVSIEDDGRGLSPHAKAGTGLTGMRERIEVLEGRFDIAPSPAGTLLSIEIPLA